jgi:hypothetical protein
MITDQSFTYAWHLWVDLFAGLHLPWGNQTTGIIALGFVFYGVGWIFKRLVSPGS